MGPSKSSAPENAHTKAHRSRAFLMQEEMAEGSGQVHPTYAREPRTRPIRSRSNQESPKVIRKQSGKKDDVQTKPPAG